MNALRLSRSGGGKFGEQPAAGPMKLAIPNAFLQEEERRGLNHKATSDGPFPAAYEEFFKDLGLQLDEICLFVTFNSSNNYAFTFAGEQVMRF